MPERFFKEAEEDEIYQFLLENSKNNKPRYEAMKSTAELFQASRSTIWRLWWQVQDRSENETVRESLRRRYKGAKRMSAKEIEAKLRKAPVFRYSTLRSTAAANGIEKLTLHKVLKRGDLVKYNSVMKPILTYKNRYERVKFSISFIRNNIQTLPFEAMKDVLHVQEKWFNFCKVKNTFYLASGEKRPERKGESKRFR